MTCTIVSCEELCTVRGSSVIKKKYFINLNNNEYVAIIWDNMINPILYDKSFENNIAQYNWYITKGGYACCKNIYMHKLILLSNTHNSVDHINEYKLDNRTSNLRLATQSQQNSNRATRCDKIKPCDELLKIGITELPKYVRWDKTESKFIIEKHPLLIKQVSNGIRKKPVMSGTKSRNLTVIDKYSDIISRLEELDTIIDSNIDTTYIRDFKINKNILKIEYETIRDTLIKYTNKINGYILPSDNTKTVISGGIRNTPPCRKTVIDLPSKCSIDPSTIPKYCYYKKASNTRGDSFILQIPGEKTWSTTTSQSISTEDKFNQLLLRYNSVNLHT